MLYDYFEKAYKKIYKKPLPQNLHFRLENIGGRYIYAKNFMEQFNIKSDDTLLTLIINVDDETYNALVQYADKYRELMLMKPHNGKVITTNRTR